MQSDAFLTGGSGLVGGHLLAALIDRGASVRALARDDVAARTVSHHGAIPVIGDLFDADALAEGMGGTDVVYHVAGVNEMCSGDRRAMDRVNVDGSLEVIRAAARTGVGRVVYTSSAVVIGERQGVVGTEQTVHSGEYVSPYARSKHLAELGVTAEAVRLGVDLVIVNPSSVQGPGRATGSAQLLLHVLNSRRPLLVESTLSIIDIEDCTNGHINAAEFGVPGERYILSGATFSVVEAVELLADGAGRQITPRWVSRSLVRRLGIPAARIAFVVKPSLDVCPELIRTLLHGHRFDGSKAAADLRLTYTEVSDTIARTVRWFREEGLIRDN
ncbi:MAG: NAD-dependent epimerase/dehydratase family protein [Actinomycetota bacterium]|nr:NAD-dependent epimerase/dehydratase family protein [Actinomycetota bacterium]